MTLTEVDNVSRVYAKILIYAQQQRWACIFNINTIRYN